MGTDENLDSANGDDRLSRIDMNGDEDNYRVQLEAGQTYTISVSGEGEAPLADPFVAVLNETEERVASDDDSGPGLDAQLRFRPEQSGTYYIQASGLGGSLGWYQISIVRQ
jgi:serralysin